MHRHHEAGHVIAGITAALSVGSVNPEVVAVETRKAQQHDRIATAGGQVVVDLAAHRPVEDTGPALPADLRPLPTVAPYDDLLTGTDPTWP